MKLKITTVAAILFIVLMLGSTIAYSFIQAVNFGLGGGSANVELPSSNLVDYGLSIEQEQLALSQDKTIIKYSYSTSCVECLSLAGQLEGLASQLGSQVII